MVQSSPISVMSFDRTVWDTAAGLIGDFGSAARREVGRRQLASHRAGRPEEHGFWSAVGRAMVLVEQRDRLAGQNKL